MSMSMSMIIPTVLASSKEDFTKQLSRIDFASHIHIDYMDGSLTDTSSIQLQEMEWNNGKTIDLHVMSDAPEKYLDIYVDKSPDMVIVHSESSADIPLLASKLREQGIKIGLSINIDTDLTDIDYILPHVQHILLFSGHLGHFGGQANLELLEKIPQILAMHKWLSFGWDGGVNNENAGSISGAGVEYINVGGAIQKSSDPASSYSELTDLLKNS